MRNFVIALMTIALVMASSLQGYANRGGHWHGGHGHGGSFGLGIVIGPGWGWPYYPAYPAYPYYYPAPAPVIREDPGVYAQPPEPSYWYYCPSPEGYYPYIKECPRGWMKVVPSPPPSAVE